MGFTREQWARDFLAALGNTSPSQQVVDFVVGWSVWETNTNSGARFNIINTTLPEPGSTFFNFLGGGLGVQNYPTYAEGIQANTAVLSQNHPGYAQLRQALASNDIGALENNAQVQRGLWTWCGCGNPKYSGSYFVSIGASHRNDTFNYGSAPSGGFTPQANTSGDTTATTPCPWANVPVVGGIYCAGWNTEQTISGVFTGSGLAGNPVAQVAAFVTSLFGKLLLFILGILLIYIGFRLLVGSPGDFTAGIAEKAAEAARAENEPGAPAPAPAAPAPAPVQTAKPAAKKKHSRVENAVTLSKAAVKAA